MDEMAKLFEDLGCKAAYNLDGGHCSFMTMQDTSGEFRSCYIYPLSYLELQETIAGAIQAASKCFFYRAVLKCRTQFSNVLLDTNFLPI